IVGVAQVMSHRRGREAHKISRGDLELLAVYLRNATTGADVDPLLFPIMRVIDEGCLSVGDADPAYADARQPDQRPQTGPDDLRVWIPRMGEACCSFGHFVGLDEKLPLCHPTHLLLVPPGY